MSNLKEETKRFEEEVMKEKDKNKKQIYFFKTGSTLLDLAISSSKNKEGGIPGGLIVEIFGPPASGKTAILAETGANAQKDGGEVFFRDPEARLDKEYCEIYGLSLKDDEHYKRPNTVNEMFKDILELESVNDKTVFVGDSLAALSTEMEMDSEDKMGMKRAKDFSAALRKTCRKIANTNLLVMFSNQERESDKGLVTPGGKGIPFYSSLRIRICPDPKGYKITESKKLGNKKIERIIGVKSICEIKKSSIDAPFKKVPLSIVFGHGIDTIRDELQWYKDNVGDTKYDCFEKSFMSINKAIEFIEENNLEEKLKDRTINLYHEIESLFKVTRKSKK